MNSNIKNEWILALRSGNYTQGKQALKYKDSYDNISHCCLGVLCDILKLETVNTGINNLAKDKTYFRFEKNGQIASDTVMPQKIVYEEVGLTIDDLKKLSMMNDSGDTFITIANYIETTL